MRDVLFALLAVLILLSAGPAVACPSCCCAVPTMGEAFTQANMIFAGQVVKVQYMDQNNSEPRVVITLKVIKVWKSSDVRLVVTLHTTSCSGFVVKRGQQFLVYAKWVKARDWLDGAGRRATLRGGVGGLPAPNDYILDVGKCSRSRLLVNSGGDIEKLGPPKVQKKWRW